MIDSIHPSPVKPGHMTHMRLTASCLDNEGGCNLQVTGTIPWIRGDDRLAYEEVVRLWNTRIPITKSKEGFLLNSCPFCGVFSEVSVLKNIVTDISEWWETGCRSCDATIIGETKEEVIAKWNRRTDQ